MFNFSKAKFPVFDLGNAIMRKIIPIQDTENYFLYMNHPEVSAYIAQGNCPHSLEDAKQDLEFWSSLFGTRRGFYWALAEKGNNTIIGSVGFNILFLSQRKGELSFDLDRSYWGAGIMTKALKEIISFSKNTLGLVRLQATSVTTNINSIRLLTRCGFIKEGKLQKYEFLHGKHVDSYMYAKILA